MCLITDYHWLELNGPHRNFVETELELWHKYYLPKNGVMGKTVIDFGAGCGETVFFFLQHGAVKVIAIEADPVCIRMLKNNFLDDYRVQIIPALVDFVKMDIEGAEKDMIVETHFLPYLEKIDVVGRGPGGPAVLTRYAAYQKTTGLLGWLHMKRINIAHMIRLLVKSI